MDSRNPEEISVPWNGDLSEDANVKIYKVSDFILQSSDHNPKPSDREWRLRGSSDAEKDSETTSDENEYISSLMESYKDDTGSFCEISLKAKTDALLSVYSDGPGGPDRCEYYFMQISKMFVDAYTVVRSVTDHEFYEHFRMGNRHLKKFNQESKAFCENARYVYTSLEDREYDKADDGIEYLSKRITLLKKEREKIFGEHERMEEVPRHDSRINFSGVLNFFLRHWMFFFTFGLLVFNMNFCEVFGALPGLWMNPEEAQFWSNAMTLLVRLFGAVCLTFVASSWVATRVVNYCLWILTELSVKLMVVAGNFFSLGGLGGIFEFFEGPAKNVGMAVRYMMISPVVFIARYIASSVCLCVLRANTFGMAGIYSIWENIQGVVGDLVMSGGESIASFLSGITSFMYENAAALVGFISRLAMKAVSAELYKATVGRVYESLSGWWGAGAGAGAADAGVAGGGSFTIEDVESEFFDVFGAGDQIPASGDPRAGQLATLSHAHREKMERATKEAMNAVTIMAHEEGSLIASQVKEVVDETFNKVRDKTMQTYGKGLLERPVNYKIISELEKLETDDLRITWQDGLVMAMLVDFVNWSWRNTAVTSRTSKYKKIFRKIRAWMPLILLMISIVITQLDMSLEDFSESGMSMVQFFNFTE